MPLDHSVITYEAPVVREGPGWRQHTPCTQHRLRCYEDCAAADATWPAVEDHFTSMTSALRTGFPTSFETAAVYNVIDEALANWDHLCTLHPTERTSADFGEDKPSRREQMAAYRDVSLNRAAARGTAIHAYVEARLLGHEPDWHDLERNGALPWVAAIEHFLDVEQPEPVLIETVCFDRERMVAGTVDALLKMRGATWEIDHKSRTQKQKRHFTHDRRPKEAAQLGGYYKMLTDGYYMDDRGRRQQVSPTDLAIGVITYGADGTYAVHEVDPVAAVDTYECSMDMREKSRLSFLMPAKPDYSEDFDPNPRLHSVIASIPDDTPEKIELSLAWKQAGFGKPSEGEVDASRFGEAMALIYRIAGTHIPFVATGQPDKTYAAEDVVRGLGERLRALPSDLRAEAERNAAGLPALASLVLTTADAEDWDRLLSVAEEAHTQRMMESTRLFRMAKEVDALHLLPEGLATWTDAELTIATAIVSAIHTEDLRVDGGKVHSTGYSQMTVLDCHGSKAAVKKIAREKAQEYGLDAPSRWEDLIADPVLWALVVAA